MDHVFGWFLLTACGVLVTARHGMVKTKGTLRTKDGSVAEVTKTADVNCRMEQVTSKEQDGSVSAIIKDFAKGKSVILKSESPDVCYVRDIPQDEMHLQEEHCLDGEMTVQSGGETLKERVYKEGGEVAASELSDELAEQCKGRRLLAMVEVTDSVSELTSTASANKRSCQTQVTQSCGSVQVDCHDECNEYGWWWGQGNCKHTNRVCATVTRCHPQTSVVCSS